MIGKREILFTGTHLLGTFWEKIKEKSALTDLTGEMSAMYSQYMAFKKEKSSLLK